MKVSKSDEMEKPILTEHDMANLNRQLVKRLVLIYVCAFIGVVLSLVLDAEMFVAAPSGWIPAIRGLRGGSTTGATAAAVEYCSWCALLLLPSSLWLLQGGRFYERFQFNRRRSRKPSGVALALMVIALWSMFFAIYLVEPAPKGRTWGSGVVQSALTTSWGLLLVGPFAFSGLSLLLAVNIFFSTLLPIRLILKKVKNDASY